MAMNVSKKIYFLKTQDKARFFDNSIPIAKIRSKGKAWVRYIECIFLDFCYTAYKGCFLETTVDWLENCLIGGPFALKNGAILLDFDCIAQ